MLSCLKLLAVFAAFCLTSARQINVTVMVPGISAFTNLANITRKSIQSAHHVRSNIKQVEKARADHIHDHHTNVTLDFNEEIILKCTEQNTGMLDIACVHELGKFVTYSWSYVFVKPALELALKKIKEIPGLLDGYEFNLIFYDSGDEKGKTSERRAQIASVDSMMKDNMAAMIGPVSNFAMTRVLTFTSHWNILHLTPGAESAALRELNKKEKVHNTMVRTGATAEQVGRCMSAILKFYNWTTTALQLFGDDPEERRHYFISEGVFSILRDDPPNFILDLNGITKEDITDDEGVMPIELEIIKLQARIILISMEMEQLLKFLAQAYMFGYDEEFVFIIVDLGHKLGTTPWNFADNIKEREKIKQMFRSSIVITLENTLTEDYRRFAKQLKRSLGRKLNNGFGEKISRSVARSIVDKERKIYNAKSIESLFEKNQYPAFFHDSLITLAYTLNNTLNEHEDDSLSTRNDTSSKANVFSNASFILDRYIINHEYEGVTGKILFNDEGDRKINFDALRYDPKRNKMRVVGHYDGDKNVFKELHKIAWPLGFPPPDVPVCGFDGSKCDIQNWTLIKATTTGFSFLVMVVLIVVICRIRQEKLKKELESQLWKVSWSDVSCTMTPKYLLGDRMVDNRWIGEVKVLSETEPSVGEVISYYVPSFSPSISAKRAMKRKRKWSSNSRKNEKIFDEERKSSIGSLISDKVWGGFTTLGLYKDKTVVIKFSNRRKLELSRKVLMELKHMRDITHEHLTRFEGACIDSPHVCVLTEYCGKGSLKDILLNDEIRMDWMFRVSLMNDLVKGMSFLHNSAIQYHGNLKSTNCVVDSRFVLKITDYGLHSFRHLPTADESFRECEKKLWTAPELLRRASNTPIATQKADVYSFGIILQEISLRKGPFYVESVTMTCKEIISKVRGGCKPYFRPLLDTSTLSEDICNLMEKCWHEEPNERPDFILTKKIIERFNRENPGNLVENLLHRMEQYAINLEGLVEERTAAYMEEKEKADELLYQMLPVPVVNRLKRGESVPAEAFESVTICFTDIVGFTSLSAASSPMQIVDLLNDLYTCFDEIIGNYDVYKVETIGDAYMLVSGLPVRNGIRHASEIARTSIHLLKAVSNFKTRHRPGDQLKLRIGIHTGPCCAGVVGLKMPRYCLFGDTVNTASRLESSGLPLAIHVSEPTKQLLDKFKSFQLQLRGDVPLKGKGTVTTYWLLGETATDFQSLDGTENTT